MSMKAGERLAKCVDELIVLYLVNSINFLVSVTVLCSCKMLTSDETG